MMTAAQVAMVADLSDRIQGVVQEVALKHGTSVEEVMKQAAAFLAASPEVEAPMLN